MSSNNNYSVEQRLFVQLSHPTSISIKLTDKEIETYTEKYTFRDSVIVDDKFNQLTLNIRGKLNKSLQKECLIIPKSNGII